MLLSTYNPSSQASCPTCNKVVNCDMIGGNLAFIPRYMDFYHSKCKTKWRVRIDQWDKSPIILDGSNGSGTLIT